MLTLSTPFLEIVGRSTLIYAFIYVGLRVSGKREMSQLSLVDFVVLLLLANAVQNAMLGPDTSLVGGMTAAGTLLLLDGIVARLLYYFPQLRKVAEGSPTVLIMHGQVIPQNLRREQISEDDLAAALRDHGFHNISEVEIAVLETSGKISMVGRPKVDRD
jgi:uncharacterized membrane protein YcaP (DUF421 family)